MINGIGEEKWVGVVRGDFSFEKVGSEVGGVKKANKKIGEKTAGIE